MALDKICFRADLLWSVGGLGRVWATVRISLRERATPRLRARLGNWEACFSGVLETGDFEVRFRDFLDFRGVEFREREELMAAELQRKYKGGRSWRLRVNGRRFEAD